MKGLGKGMCEFKEAKDSVHQEMEQSMQKKDSSHVASCVVSEL